ncbi:hypothetical protein GGI12_000450 [Dipsacomyces acuminosporus]|nr:hypothetical protein GGI12_000450 [Dipsacomyces acuminosporus]
MNTIDDSQPLVRRGFNLDTLSRYTSKAVHSPLVSYLIVHALFRKNKSIQLKKKVAAAAALWAATNFVLPGVRAVLRRLLYGSNAPVNWWKQVVVVTGGSHGVGLELAKRLLKSGARVAILDVNPFPIDEPKYKDKWRYFQCDITSLDQVKSAAEQIRAELGDPTMLVNNAGIVVAKLLLDMTDNEVDKVINVNLTSHFHLIRQFLPGMLKAKRGHIVTLGSIVSFAGTPQATTYCATKGGVKLLHESLKREIASRHGESDIQFSIAYPGVIDSGLFRGLDLGQFWMPTLQPHAIAREIFSALGSGQGREIFLPKFANVLPLIYAFSPGVRAWLINTISGGDSAMSTHTGHTMY